MASKKTGAEGVITIKKYANRRLYNTATSSYVTLDHLAQMVKDGTDFQVFDAKSGDDITKSVLTQIIFEEEAKGQNLLPIQFLRQLIRFYGDSMQAYLPSYLEMSMDSFTQNQQEMRDRMRETFGGGQVFGDFEEQVRQNLTTFQNTMRMFSPFIPGTPSWSAPDSPPSEENKSSTETSEMSELKDQLAQMQEQLNKLAKDD